MTECSKCGFTPDECTCTSSFPELSKYRRISTGTSALDVQHGGDHYKTKGIQPWEYISANDIGFFEGNVIKYVTRYKDKNGLEDLKKARHYLDYIIENYKEQ